MAENIVVPKLGLIMEEATVLEWKAKEGVSVNKGDIILVIESDKTAYDMQAFASGVLHILASEGAIVPVGDVLGQIAESKEEYDQIAKS